MATVKMLKEMLEGRDEDLYVVMVDEGNYDIMFPFNGVHQERVLLENGDTTEALVLTPYTEKRRGIRRAW